MQAAIADLFGVIVKFDGGTYVYNPNTQVFTDVTKGK